VRNAFVQRYRAPQARAEPRKGEERNALVESPVDPSLPLPSEGATAIAFETGRGAKEALYGGKECLSVWASC